VSQELARTPLFARHQDAGAKLSPFAGFEMPVVYSSIVEEHRSVRNAAGLFDVSHMGEIRLSGVDAAALAQLLFTNDVGSMQVGRVRYGMFLDESTGVIDDVTLYRVGDCELFFCVNAANTADDLAWMREVHSSSGLECEITDESEATALLAIQGPDAPGIVASLLAQGTTPPRRWRYQRTELAGIRAGLSRTGYTGEDGYEIYVAAADAVALWDRLLGAGGERVRPAGLGARDTLRMEMGYPLYGHELDREHNPIEAGLERFVAFGKGFIGEDALTRARDSGASVHLVGLVLEGRQVARAGFPLIVDGGKGAVTSGTYGPSVERSIAMGYVPEEFAGIGTRVLVEVRGRNVPCEVVGLPFYNEKRG
jgi:aminomethyltransferase